MVGQPLPEPSSGQHVNIEGFWVQYGDEEINTPENVSNLFKQMRNINFFLPLKNFHLF